MEYRDKMDICYLRMNNFHIPLDDYFLDIFRTVMRNMDPPNSKIYFDDILRLDNIICHILVTYTIPSSLRNDLISMRNNLKKCIKCFYTHKTINL